MGVTMNITVSPVNGDSLDHRVTATIFLVACIKKDPLKFEGYLTVGFGTEKEAKDHCIEKAEAFPNHTFIIHERSVESIIKWKGESQ